MMVCWLSRRRVIRRKHAGQERHPVGEIAHTECLQSTNASATCLVAAAGVRSVSHCLRTHTRHTELAHIRNDNDSACENALLSCLRAINHFSAQDDVHCARHASCGYL